MGRLEEQNKEKGWWVGFKNPNGNLAASLSQNGQRRNVCNFPLCLFGIVSVSVRLGTKNKATLNPQEDARLYYV